MATSITTTVRSGMTRHYVEFNFQEGELGWLCFKKETLKGEGNKLKVIRYSLFKIFKKIERMTFCLICH